MPPSEIILHRFCIKSHLILKWADSVLCSSIQSTSVWSVSPVKSMKRTSTKNQRWETADMQWGWEIDRNFQFQTEIELRFSVLEYKVSHKYLTGILSQKNKKKLKTSNSFQSNWAQFEVFQSVYMKAKTWQVPVRVESAKMPEISAFPVEQKGNWYTWYNETNFTTQT